MSNFSHYGFTLCQYLLNPLAPLPPKLPYRPIGSFYCQFCLFLYFFLPFFLRALSCFFFFARYPSVKKSDFWESQTVKKILRIIYISQINSFSLIRTAIKNCRIRLNFKLIDHTHRTQFMKNYLGGSFSATSVRGG